MEREDNKTNERIMRIFPEYFKNFSLPEGAREERLQVYRACRSGKCDKASFLPTFEQMGFKVREGDDICNPGLYSLSVYTKPKDIKRFAVLNSDMHIPYKIAIGYTEPEYGVIQPTRERIKTKSSHVDWWLYKDAYPHNEFNLITDFEKYLDNYKKRDDKNE